jgi:glutaredoxin
MTESISESKKAIVWSKTNCQYCEAVKIVVRQQGYEVEERKIGSGWSVQQLHESVPNAKTVPQVFLDGEYIGNYDSVVRHFGLKNV